MTTTPSSLETSPNPSHVLARDPDTAGAIGGRLAERDRAETPEPVAHTFLTVQDYALTLHLRRIPLPQPLVHVRISSRWAQARDPQAERTVLDMSLSQADLQALVSALCTGLDQPLRDEAPEVVNA